MPPGLVILEDSGLKAVDNLPLALIDNLVALEVEAGGCSLAIGLDARTTGYSTGSVETLVRNLRRKFGDRFATVFISASNDDLIRRFNATRRQHPLAAQGTLAEAVAADMQRMNDISPLADVHIDTSGAKPADLRAALLSGLGMDAAAPVQLHLISFSYRRRLPDHSDMVFDMRFAENPHWVAELRAFDGRDQEISTFLRQDEGAVKVIESYKSILTEMLPRLAREGRPILTIAFGCTGGRHRSVWASETMSAWLREQGYDVKLAHRELESKG